ncbi:Protein spinster-like protein 1 [Trichoplax sp. H2]|nr:Protein spinster-like protein 1 [Trichoplax sp. H2]|eukprot:RDD43011.1 Protein spinster-like protein 1 [Trichoplax sp. H2]
MANSKRTIFTVFVLTVMSLLNNMDRVTVSGVLPDIKKAFDLNNGQAGIIQSVFIISYLTFSPVFGFLGDRYNRNTLMSMGLLMWASVTFASSFVAKGKQHFWLFLLLRACSGIGEASYGIIAPTIIADLFTDRKRTTALALYYLAVPIGSALGFLVGTFVAKAAKTWRAAFWVSPGIGVVTAVICILFNENPPRGNAEVNSNVTDNWHGFRATSWITDIKAILKTRTYVLSSLGYACQFFTIGALAFWSAPTLYYLQLSITGHATLLQTGLYFGIILCFGGIAGVLTGAGAASYLKENVIKEGDAIVCAVGMATSGISLYLCLVFGEFSIVIAWVFVFMGCFAIFLLTTPITDILLYTIPPARRSTAEAFQIAVGHLLGDAASPYIVGAISDAITINKSPVAQSYALRYSLLICTFVCMLGCGFHLFASLTLVNDREKMLRLIGDNDVLVDDQQVVSENSDILQEKTPLLR